MLQNVGCSTGVAMQVELGFFCVNEEREVSDNSLFHVMIYILIKKFTNEIQKTIIHLTLYNL